MVYLGFYGRFSVLTGRWSDVDIIPIDHGQYLVHGLPVGRMPTMGANGFLIRSNVLKSWLGDRRYLFDVDLMQELAATSSTVLVARVKVSVTHLYAHSMGQYLRKTFRRIRDYYYFNKSHPRAYAWTSIGNERLGSVILRVLFAFPLIIDSVRSYRKQADPAWFLIWPLCFMSIMVYGVKELSSGFYFLRLRQGSRKPLGHENPRDRSSAESPSKESLSGVR